ncbi:Kinetochore-associated protein 1 [Geranomyces michiganensis]|nr:Kinetochore-associated protein 1 [Geranomyces michiganensis]
MLSHSFTGGIYQSVLKAKLKQMASDVNVEDMITRGTTEEFVDRLIDDLKDVEDVTYQLEFCLRTLIPTFRGTYRLLSFARALAHEVVHVKGAKAAANASAIVAVHKAIRRIGTYQLVAFERLNRRGGVDLDARNWDDYRDSDGFSAREWQVMREADLVSEIRELIRSGDLGLAVVIWKRHFLDEKLLTHIYDIVMDIPDHASLDDFVPWLRTEVLPIVQITQDRMRLAVWIDHRARLVEAREKRPHGALQVVLLLDKVALPGLSATAGNENGGIARTSARDHQLFTPATPAYYVENAVLFAQTSGVSTFGFDGGSGKVWSSALKKQLEDLVYLWDRHDFCVTLDRYSQMSLGDIAKDLLDRVAAPELLPDAIDKHFRPYVTRNGLSFEDLLAEYCIALIDGSLVAGGACALADGSWQARILAILQTMSDVDIKVDVVMELMKRTPVPWGADVGEVFLQALRCTAARRNDELREQYRLLKLKRMLVSYGIKTFNIADKNLAKSLPPRILSRLDFVHAMKDALQVVSAYHHLSKMEAYGIRLVNLFEAGLIDRALRLLRTGEEEPSTDVQRPDDDGLGLELDAQLDVIQQIGVGKEVAIYLQLVMDDAVEMEKSPSSKAEALSTYAWSISAAVALSDALANLHDELLVAQTSDANLASSSSSTATVSAPPSNMSRPLLTAALDPALCGYQNAQIIFRNLGALFNEFDVMMTMANYADDAQRRKILATFAKKVFKYVGNPDVGKSDLSSLRTSGRTSRGKSKVLGSVAAATNHSTDLEATQTALYRLAHVLGFERSRLRGILAEEAARNGDFRSALILCKELFDKFPNSDTARTLQRVAHLLTQYAAENKQVYRDVKTFRAHSRLTSRIMQLSAQAFCICDIDGIEAALDAFKNYELQHTIFTQCDAGDYEALVARERTDVDPGNSQAFDDNIGSAVGSSASSSFIMKRAHTTSTVEPDVSKPEMELANISDRFSASLFDGYFRENSLVLSTETAMDLVSAFVLDATAASDISCPFLLGLSDDYAPSSKGKRESARGHPTHSGRQLAKYLSNNKSLQAVLRVQQRANETTLRTGGSKDEQSWQEGVALHVDTLEKLLAEVFSSRVVDQKLAVGCLVALPEKEGFLVFKSGMVSAGHEFSRVLHIAVIGIAVATAWGQRTFRINCEDLAANAKWWHQLRLLGIPFDDKLFKYRVETQGHQRHIVPELLRQTGFDLLTALEFGRSYDIDDDYVIVEYVKGLILTADEHSDYQSLVAGTLDETVNKDRMVKALIEDCLPRVSSYDYERIQFIAMQISRLQPESEIVKTCREVINVLSDYQRLIPPGIHELLTAAQWTLPGSAVLEHHTVESLMSLFPMSIQRLPYHALVNGDPWMILRPEMSEESIPRLRPLRKILNLHPDQFYVVAIENVFCAQPEMLDGLPTADSEEGSSPLGPNGIKLRFANVKRLVINIADDKTAVETLMEIGRRFPCGPDRISAYKMALTRAERLADPAQGDGVRDNSTGAQCIRNQLIITETEHQLRSLNMKDMLQYISVEDNMTRLMHNLYLHKSELALDPKNDLDLHGVINDIAKRCDVDVEEFRQFTLNRWLSAEVAISDEEREMHLPSMRVQINNVLNSREEVSIQMRLLYLLRSLPVGEATDVLVAFVSKQKSSQISTLNRVRALSVLFQLASARDLARKYGDFTEYMCSLLYLADCEELRINISTREFVNCDKEAFVRSLWVNHKDELKVVQLICNICLDYNVYDLTLWESALHSLLGKRVYRYLLGMLEHLASVPELAQIRSLPKIWNDVLMGCLQLLADRQDTTLEMYDRVLTLVQKCPSLPELNVDAFVEHFDRMAMKTPATFDDLLNALKGIAALPPTTGMAETIKKCVSRLDSSELVQALDAMSGGAEHSQASSSGPGTPASSMRADSGSETATDTWIGKTWVIRAIYDRIDGIRAYEILLTTRHLSGFVRHLVECDRIEALMLASIRAHRTSAAYQILLLYYSRFPDRLPLHPLQTYHQRDGDSPPLTPGAPSVSDYAPADLIELYMSSRTIGDDEY